MGGVCLVAGVVLLLAVAGTSDVRSLTSTDAGLASGSSVWLMLFAGSFLLGTGAFISTSKEGRMDVDDKIVLENFEGEGEAVSVSLRALIGEKKSPKEKKEEECCGKHEKCNRVSHARRKPNTGGKK